MRIEYRIFWLWRLIAALLVMAYHFGHYASNAPAVIDWFERMSPLLDMFFILSGFLIFDRYGGLAFSRASYGQFLLRRFARLYPLHLATLGFFVAVGVAVRLGVVPSQGGISRYDFSQLLPNLLLVQAWGLSDALTFNYVSWSLSAEWFAYLTFPLIVVAFRFGGTAALAMLLAITIAALEFADAGATDKRLLWYEAKLWGAYRVFADFVFGAVLSSAVVRWDMRLKSLAPAWLAMAGAALAMHFGLGFYGSIFLIGLAIVFGAAAERGNPSSSRWMVPLLPVAAISFGIYLWHPVAESIMFGLVWRYAIATENLVSFWAFVAVAMAATIVLAMTSARFFEAPLARFLLERFGGRRDAAAIGTGALESQPATH